MASADPLFSLASLVASATRIRLASPDLPSGIRASRLQCALRSGDTADRQYPQRWAVGTLGRPSQLRGCQKDSDPSRWIRDGGARTRQWIDRHSNGRIPRWFWELGSARGSGACAARGALRRECLRGILAIDRYRCDRQESQCHRGYQLSASECWLCVAPCWGSVARQQCDRCLPRSGRFAKSRRSSSSGSNRLPTQFLAGNSEGPA